MKEKDLDQNLENIIIDGLIKEAEQENADFAAEMRKMSDEEFEEMIYQPAYADSGEFEDDYSSGIEGPLYREVAASVASASVAADREERISSVKRSLKIPRKSRSRRFLPWITAAVAAAAVILIVLIPSINSMNAKLCDSALYMSEAYISAPKGGFDVSSASIEQIKKELPNLEERYLAMIEKEYNQRYHGEDFQDAGWTLAVAYLKLHKKGDAIKVLETLESQTQGTPFGDHCKELLKQLE